MLVGLADRLHRQDADVHVSRRALDQQVQVPLVDDRVRTHRQMRAVLLDRRRREDCDRLVRIEAVEFEGGEVVPPDLAVSHVKSLENQPGVAAIASISTTNSGRAKPETIISVDAG